MPGLEQYPGNFIAGEYQADVPFGIGFAVFHMEPVKTDEAGERRDAGQACPFVLPFFCLMPDASGGSMGRKEEK